MNTHLVGQELHQNRRLVAVLGASLYMDMVESSLRQIKDLGVVRIDTNLTDIAGQIISLHPDLVALDMNTPQFPAIVALLRDQPGIPILCLDATCQKVLTLSSQQHIPLTVDDLAQVVQKQVFRNCGTESPSLAKDRCQNIS